MACEFDCKSGVSAFPASLTCVQIDGYQETQERSIIGLNSQQIVNELPKVSFKIIVKGKMDTQIFSYWWINEVKYGVEPFTVSLTLFGVEREWIVRATNDLGASMVGVLNREYTLDCEVLEDVSAIISEAVEAGFCNICNGG